MIARFILRRAALAVAVIAILFILPLHAATPTVANVRASQRAGTKLVDIYYDVTGTTSPVTVGLQISENGGGTFAVPVIALSGDIGTPVIPGRGKHIVWNAATDWNLKVTDTMKFRVSAEERDTRSFALIPAGNFTMGDQSNPLVGGSNELPVHSVYVSEFYMAKYETTKELWDEVRVWALNNGYTDLPVGNGSNSSKGENHPVYSISWYAMVKWCNARSQKEGLTPCYTVLGATYKTGSSAPVCNWSASGYRLPTEAEWEKAARGGVAGKNFPWGTDMITHSQANYNSSSLYTYDISPTRGHHPTYAVGGYPYTAPVGNFAPNGYGLYDMAGNVLEWCWDWYGSSYYASSPGSDPRGPGGTRRVLRDGGWYYDSSYCRVAYRDHDYPSDYNFYRGFRLARSSVL